MKIAKSILKYAVTLGIASWLLWYVYKDQDLSGMIQRLKHVDYQWIVYSFFLSIISHIFRSYRWNLLLKPLGYNLQTSRTFLAVMVGYFVNLIVPRAGEISKCGILKKTDNVNLAASIGTVVAERAVDFMMLCLAVIAAFAVEFELLNQYVRGLIENRIVQLGRNIFIVYVIGAVALFMILVVYILIRKYKRTLKRSSLFLKIRHLMRELVEGLTSIRKVDNLAGFFAASVIIWAMYFLMSYVAFNAIPETSHLGFVAGMSVLAMSSLGMLAPVQGGIGAYHALVTGALAFYGISEQDGAFFAGLLHSSQIVMILLVGGASFIISLLIRKRDARKEPANMEEPARA